MPRPFRGLFALAALVIMSGTPSRAADASARVNVTRVVVKKRAHSLQVLAAKGRGGEEAIFAEYKVALGPGGLGPKRQEGDMTTPVGRYHVTTHQPSRFRIFLRLDSPTAADYRRFAALKARG